MCLGTGGPGGALCRALGRRVERAAGLTGLWALLSGLALVSSRPRRWALASQSLGRAGLVGPTPSQTPVPECAVGRRETGGRVTRDSSGVPAGKGVCSLSAARACLQDACRCPSEGTGARSGEPGRAGDTEVLGPLAP